MRILYISFPTGQIAGGQKMIARHVEALREVGFDAVWWRGEAVELPWLTHTAPVEVQTPLRDDFVVVPCDAPNAIQYAAKAGNPTAVFVQGHITFASTGGLEAVRALRDPIFLAVGPTTAAAVRRAFPTARIEVLPGFADERIFKPREKTHAVAHAPWKRALEAAAIRSFLKTYHRRHAKTPWATILNASEAQVAEGMGRCSIFLSLSRLEGLGLTPLEAMASGCLVAGFMGLGGRDFATPDNGFWVADEDCVGAADALAEAADVWLTGGPALARRLDAARATAEAWSYARFRTRLEEVWTALAPDARLRGDAGVGARG
ncbi:glycosyltransferase [Phenylobacterium sp.]|uniref:glycosyltransferase n=1 Tax=Phenylobacterium sp. TaxID=1871053 RepID=UPI002ED9A032